MYKKWYYYLHIICTKICKITQCQYKISQNIITTNTLIYNTLKYKMSNNKTPRIKTVNQRVTGSSPVRGAFKINAFGWLSLKGFFVEYKQKCKQTQRYFKPIA